MLTPSECLHPKTYISIAGTTVCRTCYQQVLVATADWTGSTALRWGLNRAEQRELEALAELDEAKAEITRLRAAINEWEKRWDFEFPSDAALAPEEVSGRSCVQCESFLGHPSFGPCEHRPTGGQR